MLFPVLHDWRSSSSRWSSLPILPALLAGDRWPLPRYVVRWLCQRCEQYYMGDSPAPPPCPNCEQPLAFVARWDLRTEGVPRWHMGPGERP